MSNIELNWIGGAHTFALKLGQLRALQKTCDAGPEEVLARIWSGGWRVDDLFEPIRLGLIGSGAMTGDEAGPFVTKLFEQHPLMNFKHVAAHILGAALVEEDDDPVGEPAGETPPDKNGSSAKSTVQVR